MKLKVTTTRHGKIVLLKTLDISLVKVKLDKHGYTSSGDYFGTGMPVYMAEAILKQESPGRFGHSEYY